MSDKDEIKEALIHLLDESIDYYQIKESIMELYTVFSRLSGISGEPLGGPRKRDILLKEGMAIAPDLAAHCLFDIMRTKKFLQGVYLGIREAQKRFPGKRIHILYAGTGPYATLGIPFTTLFTSGEISFSLLDIYQESIESVKVIINKLGISDYINDIKCCDATSYKPANPFHILVTETMQRALAKEPQVAIARHLAPQLMNRGIMIPQNVYINLAIFSVQADSTGQRKETEIFNTPIFELSLETVDNPWDPVTIKLPEVKDEQARLGVLTGIRTFGDIILKKNESGLTVPWMLYAFDHKKIPGALTFSYQKDPLPRIRYQAENNLKNIQLREGYRPFTHIT